MDAQRTPNSQIMLKRTKLKVSHFLISSLYKATVVGVKTDILIDRIN